MIKNTSYTQFSHSIRSVRALTAAVAGVLAAPLAVLEANFTQILSVDDVEFNSNTATIQNFVFDGSTAYVAVGGTVSAGQWDGHAVQRVTGVGTATPAVTTLMTSGDWGTGFFSPIHSFQRTGDFVQFGTTGAAAVLGIHRVNVDSGGLTTRFDQSAIIAASGASNYAHLGASTTDAAGEFYFANTNAQNRALLHTSGTDVNVLLDSAQLTALFDGAANQSINAMALAGTTLVLANNSATTLAAYNTTDGTTSTLLNEAQLDAGGLTGNFARLFAAPNGLVYASTSNRGIFSFDPSDAAGTWSFIATTGDTTVWNVQALGWYEDELAFATTSGIYAIPEPRLYAALLGLGALALVWLRRRRG
ncbi:MAG: hypothetical protein JJU00_18030 [Opitutales bacterium]|nr:hypothetical protein [Opitutales bacterium]